jgi:Undecaprenyl-phosphate glucose phosphotransferase
MVQTPEPLPRRAEAPQPAPESQSAPRPTTDRPEGPSARWLRSNRLRLDTWFIARLLAVSDWVLALAVPAVAIKYGLRQDFGATTLAQASVLFGAVLAMKIGLWLADAYADPASSQGRAERAVGGVAIGVLAAIGLAAVTSPTPLVFLAIGASAPLAGMSIAGLHALVGLVIRDAAARGALSETAVIVGATEAAERLIARTAKSNTLRVVAVFDDRADRAPDRIGGAPVLGSIEDLMNWEHLPAVDRIIVCVSQKAEGRVRALLERLRIAPNRVDLVLDLDGVAGGEPLVLESLGDMPTARVSGGGLSRRRATMKRFQDLLFAIPMLICFGPIMMIIAALIKADSKGPILFKQKREGFNNRVITVFKFRSMQHNASCEGGPLVQVQAKDPRVTKIGGFLRRTSLDELPQLFNVLAGDMSLVGPRPHAIGMKTGDVATSSIVREYAHRHRIKPGLTGWAQINGSRGPVESAEEVRERVRYDLEYLSRASFWFDVWIMLRTVPALLGDELRTR